MSLWKGLCEPEHLVTAVYVTKNALQPLLKLPPQLLTTALLRCKRLLVVKLHLTRTFCTEGSQALALLVFHSHLHAHSRSVCFAHSARLRRPGSELLPVMAKSSRQRTPGPNAMLQQQPLFQPAAWKWSVLTSVSSNTAQRSAGP